VSDNFIGHLVATKKAVLWQQNTLLVDFFEIFSDFLAKNLEDKKFCVPLQSQ